MKLTLNHVAAPDQGARFLIGLVLAAALASLCGWQLMQMRTERSSLEQRLQQAQDARKPVQVTAIQPQALSATQKSAIKEANTILGELGRPWPALLNRLEQVAQPEIALLAIRPDAAKGRLRLKGEAKDMPSLLAYMQRLEAVPEMQDVTLDEHEMMEKPQDGGMAHFIRFGITTRWGAS
ncbi:PilN domain-containing protein [Methylobacillus methanolivorans]|uniref:PilN domain-containing protein n=1 Tax=Methylobacillus methanolivorans TaxID=1848927 RepID=A0ABW8GNL8_9PROT